MMKLQFNSAATWIGFLLINILAISCGCGETPEEKKLKDLQAKNKQATKKISEILKTRLNINSTPEQEKSINEAINKARKEATVEVIDKGISSVKEALKNLESMDDETFQKEIDEFKNHMRSMGVIGLDAISIDRDTLKQLMTTILELMQNIKEELEIKNKGKKTGNKKPSGEK